MSDTVQPGQLEQRIRSLEHHLERENPILLESVRSFRQLDEVAYRLGLLDRDESYATRVSWWPLISILGTFSSGKSTFINHFLGQKLQSTGNQAVDDKFTVITYSSDGTSRVLPGLSLDADPRFPFYQVSTDIESVASGEGRRVDAYLQLKTCPSEKLRGKILIDSPGFDADAQRTSTLRITDHIMDLSDLVLVFFDARHPEPGAMQDTLEHLVTNTYNRPDSSKFLYVLNQIDTAAREDNPEEVFAAWQRALGQRGLTAGRFYRIYSPEAAVPIDDPVKRQRFEAKRDQDLAEIHGRMQQVEVERAYRLIGVLEKTAKNIEGDWVPRLQQAKDTWKRRVLWTDAILAGLVLVVAAAALLYTGAWREFSLAGLWGPEGSLARAAGVGVAALLALVLAVYVHFSVRHLHAVRIGRGLGADIPHLPTRESLRKAFARNTRPWRSVFFTRPVGWGRRARSRLAEILAEADRYVQTLNDRFTNPSGLAPATPVDDGALALEPRPAGGPPVTAG
ncbi:MAG: dynamin family protein [Gammaproteobacteria bacterium]|jgi:hypothetical protein|nr:dynamin family protein [Gammaproteobacteria bacterium]